MSLQVREPEPVDVSFPRVSGDEPTFGERSAYEQMFSPRERG